MPRVHEMAALACVLMGALCLLIGDSIMVQGFGPPLIHNLTLGKPGKYDKLLYLQHVKRGAQRGGVSQTVHYPPAWPPLEFITAIQVEDLWRNGSNGFPYLAGGGLYQREATVRLVSGPRYGLDFLVKFYGH